MPVQASTGLATALGLAEMGAALVEARFRREHPDASAESVAAHARAWWLARPGAPTGDCPGPVRGSTETDESPGALAPQRIDHLTELVRRFALADGLAVAVRPEPRLTRDTDRVVSVADDAGAENLVLQLRAHGYEWWRRWSRRRPVVSRRRAWSAEATTASSSICCSRHAASNPRSWPLPTSSSS